MIAGTAAPLQMDSVFPQRDLLLDCDYVAQQLSQLLGRHRSIRIENCERIRVTYRPGQSLRLVYKFCADGEPGMVAARAFATWARRKSPVDELPPGACDEKWNSYFCDEETSTCFWTFPHDRKIANLAALMQVPPALADLLDSQWVRSRLAGYASEKCATVQCLDKEEKVLAYAKIYAGNEGQSCFSAYESLFNFERAFRVPRPILYSASLQLLILEAIQGRRIADLSGKELERGFYSLGRALAAFHGAPIPEVVPEFTRFNPDRLQETRDTIALVRSDLRDSAQRLCESLLYGADAFVSPAVCLHGDVHPKNGILIDDQVVLIDLDQIARGPAAADLGSLLAALRYEAVIGTLSEADEQRLGEAFLTGYNVLRPLPEPRELKWCTAAALFAERASRAITRIRTQGLEKLPQLLNAAQEILEAE
jgi:hypothetical protein